MRYRAEVDGLRAVAVLPVILFHAGFAAFPGGYIGVDVFFVISGYLITLILVEETEQGEFSFLRFYERRARRILPALLVVLAVSSAFAWAWLLPEQLRDFADSLSSVLVFLSNFYFLQQVSYFAPAAELQPLLHTWSLAVEEQYYLLFPLVVVVAARFGPVALLRVTLVLTLASLVLSQIGNGYNAEKNFFFSPSRFWELGAGSLAALITRRHGELSNGPLAALGLVLILGPVFLYDKDMATAGLYMLAPVCGAVLIVMFAREGTLVCRCLGHPLLVRIGLISYSAYLIHQPLFVFARIRSAEEPGPTAFALLCILTLGLAWLSWRFVERPFRGERSVFLPDRRRFAKAAVVTTAALMAAVVLADLDGGLSRRAPERYAGNLGVHAFYREMEARSYPCTPRSLFEAAPVFQGKQRCLQSKADAAPTVALVGDSHAEQLFPGVARALPLEVVSIYWQEAPPFRSDPKMQDIFAELARNQALHTVILATHWPRRFSYYGDDAGFRKELADTLAALKAQGLSVFVVGDLPWFVSEPEACKFGLFGQSQRYCTAERADSRLLRERYLPIMTDVAKMVGVPIIEVRDIFCSGADCSMVRGDTILFRDSDHLNSIGADLVGAKVATSILTGTRPEPGGQP